LACAATEGGASTYLKRTEVTYGANGNKINPYSCLTSDNEYPKQRQQQTRTGEQGKRGRGGEEKRGTGEEWFFWKACDIMEARITKE
jgi:hypothetical protein